MVGLQKQGITLLQMGQNMRRGVPKVGQHPEFDSPVRTGKLQGFTGVVGHGEGCDLQPADINAHTILRDAEPTVKVGAIKRREGALTHPHWHPMAARKLTGATDMVAVLVGDENGVDVLIRQACLAKPRGKLPQPQTTIDEKAKRGVAARLDQCGVSGTSATEALEPYHRAPTDSGALNYLRSSAMT